MAGFLPLLSGSHPVPSFTGAIDRPAAHPSLWQREMYFARVSAGAAYSGAATPTRAAVLTSVSQLPSGMGMPFFRRSASIRHSGSPATITSS